MVMALAKYTIQIPTSDNEGNALKDLATAAQESLWRYAPKARIEGARVVRGVEGFWHGEADAGTFDDLVVFAEDSPEIDSTVKELAVHVCEVANQWGIFVMKEGSSAPITWTMTSPNADGQGPADPVALRDPITENTAIARAVARYP